MSFNSWLDIWKFNGHITGLQKQTDTQWLLEGFCGFGATSVPLAVPFRFHYRSAPLRLWLQMARGNIFHGETAGLLHKHLLTKVSYVHEQGLFVSISINTAHHKYLLQQMLCHRACILLWEPRTASKIHSARTGAKSLPAFSALHRMSPICNNKACCGKLNIATWSYDIRQAVRTENHKQSGTLDMSFNLAETLLTNFLPLYFINDSSQPNGILYPFNPAHFLSQRCRGYINSTKGSLEIEKDEEISFGQNGPPLLGIKRIM